MTRTIEVHDPLLEPFGITRFYTDGWGAYERHIDPEKHEVGKEQTQNIESKHINLRTRIKRLVRRTICFSKTTTMHDLVREGCRPYRTRRLSSLETGVPALPPRPIRLTGIGT